MRPTIIPADTIRESTGLALSSRNSYLTTQRDDATQLHATLQHIAAAIKTGSTHWRDLERDATSTLNARGWRTDYIAIRRQADLGAPTPNDPLVILAAARLGTTRLIDNLELP